MAMTLPLTELLGGGGGEVQHRKKWYREQKLKTERNNSKTGNDYDKNTQPARRTQLLWTQQSLKKRAGGNAIHTWKPVLWWLFKIIKWYQEIMPGNMCKENPG